MKKEITATRDKNSENNPELTFLKLNTNELKKLNLKLQNEHLNTILNLDLSKDESEKLIKYIDNAENKKEPLVLVNCREIFIEVSQVNAVVYKISIEGMYYEKKKFQASYLFIK
jgi:hypothetical protein